MVNDNVCRGCRTPEPQAKPDMGSSRASGVHSLPSGWVILAPGYAVDHGQTKEEKKDISIRRLCDARGGMVRTWAYDGKGVPAGVVSWCIFSAQHEGGDNSRSPYSRGENTPPCPNCPAFRDVIENGDQKSLVCPVCWATDPLEILTL